MHVDFEACAVCLDRGRIGFDGGGQISLVQAVKRKNPDLVIADLSCPTSGVENVSRLLKRHNMDIRRILMSLNDEPEVVNEMTEVGADGFVLKQRIAIDLVPAVKEICQGRRYISQDVKLSL